MELEKMLELLGMMLIAVVIITFLVPQRAWGETSLMNLFTGQDANSNDGDPALGHKALHVKTDVEDSSNPNVYEFHMTDQGVYGNKHLVLVGFFNEKIYFALRNWNKDKCSLFTTRKIPDIVSRDIFEVFNYVYYVDAGAIIDSSCNSLDKCITDKTSSSGCKNICPGFEETSQQPSDFSVCGQCWGEGLAKENKVLTQPFSKGTDFCNDNTAGCPSDSNGGCCPIVGEEPSKKYTPQYGLICGYEQVSGSIIDPTAKWFACTDDIDSKGRKVFTDKSGGIQFKCESKKWALSGDQGVQMLLPQIKQIGLVDEEIEVGFNIMNYRGKDISNMVITLTPQDKNGNKPSACFNDDNKAYRELAAIKTLKPPPDKAVIDEKDFCLDTRKFVVAASYTYDSKNEIRMFKLDCPSPAKNDVWYGCTLS